MLSWVLVLFSFGAAASFLRRHANQHRKRIASHIETFDEQRNALIVSSRYHLKNLSWTHSHTNVQAMLADRMNALQTSSEVCFMTMTPCSFPSSSAGETPHEITNLAVVTAIEKLEFAFNAYLHSKEDKIAVYAPTSAALFTVMLTCLRYGRPLVTIFSTLKGDAVTFCLKETKATLLFTTETQFPKSSLTTLSETDVQTVVYLPSDRSVKSKTSLPSAASSSASEIKSTSSASASASVTSTSDRQSTSSEIPTEMKSLSIDQFLAGSNYSVQDAPLTQDTKTDDKAILYMYTSGTSGIPKAVLITGKNIATRLRDFTFALQLNPGERMLGYLPLAHILELTAELYCWLNGLVVAYGKPDVTDLSILHPHMMPAVPLILDRLLANVKSQMQGTGWKALVARNILAFQVFLWKYFEWYPNILDLAFSLKSRLGGNLKFVICGGAKLSKETYELLSACGMTIFNAYGLTETIGAATMNDASDRLYASVGVPFVSTKIMLLDLPGRYLVKNGKGVIHICGEAVTQAYFKRPDLDVNFITFAGVVWFNTGDIGELRDGNLIIVDREKDLVKSASGEYLSLTELETLYSQYPYFKQVCFQMNEKSELIAYVVMDRRVFNKKDIAAWIEAEKIILVKVPNDYVICKKEFNAEDGTLTALNKLCRHKIYAVYGKRVSGRG